jgi:hypothetical protein
LEGRTITLALLMTLANSHGFISFIKFTWVYLIHHKSEVFQVLYAFQELDERTFNRKILGMQTDRGGEYKKLNTFFTRVGISHRVSCPHTH